MNCEEARVLIADRLDGDLPAGGSAGLEAHLADCAACSGILQEWEALRARSRNLPRTLDPGQDLWASIRGRLGSVRRRVPGAPSGRGIGRRSEPRRLRTLGLCVAAALVLLLLGARILRTATAPSAGRAPLLASWEEEYLETASRLFSDLHTNSSRLPAGTMETIEENLLVLDAAIADSRSAASGDPTNMELQLWLSGTWRRKIDLLDRAARIVASF